MNDEFWGEDLKINLREIDEMFEALIKLRDLLKDNLIAKDVIPIQQSLPKPIDDYLIKIFKILQQIRDRDGQLFNRLSSEPVGKFLQASKLTKEEFYLLKAMDEELPFMSAKDFELSDWDDFDFFNYFIFEDEQTRSYINPMPIDDLKRVKLKIGCPPEDLSIKRLRPEQHNFFQKYLPEVYARFKR